MSMIFGHQIVENINTHTYNNLLSLIRHGPHRKRRVQQFLYFYVYVCCCANVFTELLPGNDRGIHIQTHRLMGGSLRCAQLP
jgi:hypothetical protein